jgi:hypothetical protein
VSCALIWKYFGLNQIMNEAAVGMITGFLINYLLANGEFFLSQKEKI